MDLLFLLCIGEKVNLSVRNRFKLVRDFEFLIDYNEMEEYSNNFVLKRNDDSFYNQFVKMIERRANKCKSIREKLNTNKIENVLNNWCETNYYI